MGLIDNQVERRTSSHTVRWDRIGGTILGTTSILGGFYLEQLAWDQPNHIGKMTVALLSLLCMGWGLSLFDRMIDQIRFEFAGRAVPLGQIDENMFSQMLRLGSGLFCAETGLQWTFMNVTPPKGTPPHMEVALLVIGTYLLLLVPIHTAIRHIATVFSANRHCQNFLTLTRRVLWWITAPVILTLAPYVSLNGRISRETFWRQLGFLYAVVLLANIVQTLLACLRQFGSRQWLPAHDAPPVTPGTMPLLTLTWWEG